MYPPKNPPKDYYERTIKFLENRCKRVVFIANTLAIVVIVLLVTLVWKL